MAGTWLWWLSRINIALVDSIVFSSPSRYPPNPVMIRSMRIDCMPATLETNGLRIYLTLKEARCVVHTSQPSTTIWHQQGAINLKYSEVPWSDRGA